MEVKSHKVAIIGAGIAGIATSIRLAARGNEVHVYESNDYPGGKLSEIKIDGYRFDAGPSLFTMPSYVKELFEICGENMDSYFQYHRLDTACHYFYEDGTQLHAYSDRDKLIKELTTKLYISKQEIEQVLTKSAFLYEHLGDLFMNRSLHDWRTWWNPSAFKAYRKLHKMDFFRSLHAANRRSFKDKRAVQLFDRYATYNGSDPYQTPATLGIIPHLEFGIGAFFPQEGMISITNALVALAKRQGVIFHFNHAVEEIITRDESISGVRVKGECVQYDRIVSNMDITGTYKKLLPNVKAPEKLLSQPKSSSALIFYWGIRHSFPQLDLHNIFFSSDYKKEFEAIFKKNTVCDDPTVYVNITSKYKKEDAPEGNENWFTMINVPHNTGQNWDHIIESARKNIVAKLGRLLNKDIESLIACEDVLDPRSIELKTGSSKGALYGNSSNNRFSAFLRHANYSQKIKGLYFCGGSVHPGGGIPMCLSSARIVDRYFH